MLLRRPKKAARVVLQSTGAVGWISKSGGAAEIFCIENIRTLQFFCIPDTNPLIPRPTKIPGFFMWRAEARTWPNISLILTARVMKSGDQNACDKQDRGAGAF
jgi:hypothetical protein